MANIETKQIITIDTRKAAASLRELQAEINAVRSALAKMQQEGQQNSAAYQQQTIRLKSAQTEYNRVMRLSVKELQAVEKEQQAASRTAQQVVQSSKAVGNSYNALSVQLAKLKEEWKATGDVAKRNELGREINKVKAQLNDLDHSIGNWQRNVGNYWGSIRNGLTAMVGWITAVIVAVRKLGQSVKVIVQFEQSLANLGSILGATDEQLKGLENSALQLGRTTEWTASQVVLLQTELAKLGFAPAQIQNMQASILQFATATGADLPRAAAFAGAALRAFGLQSKDTTDLLNVMAKATTTSALDFNKLETSISVVAPVAKSFGLSARDTAALLGTLSNAGFDASTAATALRNILLEYSKDGGKVQKTIGGQVHDFNGLLQSFRNLTDAGLDLAQANDLVGKRSASALLVLADMVGTTDELRQNLEDVDGTLSTIQERRLNTLEGETKLLKSAWEGLNLSLSESKGFLRDIVHWATAAVDALNQVLFRQARVQGSQADQQAAIDKIYEEKGAQEAVTEALNHSRAAYKAYDDARKKTSVYDTAGLARVKELKEYSEAATQVYKDTYARQQADAKEAAEAEARDKAAQYEAQLEAQEQADEKAVKEAAKTAKILEGYQDQLADQILADVQKEGEALNQQVTQQIKADEKRAKSAEEAAKRIRKATENNALAAVGDRQTGAEVTARATIDDEAALAAALYEIRKKSNEDRLALLRQFAQEAYNRGDLEEYLAYNKQAADMEVKIAQDAETEKARIRRKGVKDAEEQAKREREMMKATAAVMGNVASAYQAYIQQRVEGGKISEEQAEQEFKSVKAIQYAQTMINTLAGMMSVWAGEGTNAMKAVLSASVLTQGLAAAMQISNTTLGSTAQAAQAVTSAAVAAPVVINAMPQVQAVTSASQEAVLNERAADQRVYVVYSDIERAGRKTRVTEGESRF